MSNSQYRPVGGSGLMVSNVGLGCNNFGARLDPAGSRAVVDAAIDAGVNLLDTADIYGQGASETILGEVLAGRRDDVVLATKFGMDMQGKNGQDHDARGSRRYIRRAVEASLRRLATDHIDLYQYHTPDGVTPIEETLAALSELVDEGKVRYIGSSNLDAWQVVDADRVSRICGHDRFISAQNEYSLLDRRVERELVPACRRSEIGILPFYPLANGLLTGKYQRGEPAPPGTRLVQRAQVLESADFDRIDALRTVGAELGKSLLDLAIGRLLAEDAVASVISGAMSGEQLLANVAAGAWTPTPEEVEVIDAATMPA